MKNPYLVVKDWKLSPQDQEQDKDVQFYHFYSSIVLEIIAR